MPITAYEAKQLTLIEISRRIYENSEPDWRCTESAVLVDELVRRIESAAIDRNPTPAAVLADVWQYRVDKVQDTLDLEKKSGARYEERLDQIEKLCLPVLPYGTFGLEHELVEKVVARLKALEASGK